MAPDVTVSPEWTDWTARTGDLGYFLLPEFWGRGLGTECARLVFQFAFGECAASVMHASCDARNVGSEAVLRKIGMCLDREQPDSRRRAYSVTRQEWAAAGGARC